MYCDDWPARTTYRVPLRPRTGSMSRVIGWTCHTAPSVCVIYCQSIIWPSVYRCWRVNSPTSSFSRRPLICLCRLTEGGFDQSRAGQRRKIRTFIYRLIDTEPWNSLGWLGSLSTHTRKLIAVFYGTESAKCFFHKNFHGKAVTRQWFW